MLTDRPDKPGSEGESHRPSTLGSSALRADDPAAWERLVGRYYPAVYRWCRRAGLRPDDAADVCQEVFRSVAASLPGFRREQPGHTFGGWLRRITQRRLADHRRQRQGQPQAEGGSDALERLRELADDQPSASSAQGVRAGRLSRVLDAVHCEFEEPTWQAFWQVTVDGRPAAEVAAALGLTANAVYLAKSRVLRRLREDLVKHTDGERGSRPGVCRASEP